MSKKYPSFSRDKDNSGTMRDIDMSKVAADLQRPA